METTTKDVLMSRRSLFSYIAAALLVGLGASPLVAAEPLAKDIDWAANLNSARTRALQHDRPILIVFGADWCKFCKELEKKTLSHPQMVKYINSRFVPVHLDHDKEQRVAKILEVESLPCSIILSPEADLLGKVKGYQTPSQLYKHLSAAEKLQARIRQASNTQAISR